MYIPYKSVAIYMTKIMNKAVYVEKTNTWDIIMPGYTRFALVLQTSHKIL